MNDFLPCAKRKCWLNHEQCLCELGENGEVAYAENITKEELKYLVKALLLDQERELRI